MIAASIRGAAFFKSFFEMGSDRFTKSVR